MKIIQINNYKISALDTIVEYEIKPNRKIKLTYDFIFGRRNI